MGYENDLCELGGLIADAAEGLRRAAALALRIAGDDAPSWPAMDALVGKLDEVNRLLIEMPGAEIAGAIAQAEASLDEMSDRADGASY